MKPYYVFNVVLVESERSGELIAVFCCFLFDVEATEGGAIFLNVMVPTCE